jgi:hypothetical protein
MKRRRAIEFGASVNQHYPFARDPAALAGAKAVKHLRGGFRSADLTCWR